MFANQGPGGGGEGDQRGQGRRSERRNVHPMEKDPVAAVAYFEALDAARRFRLQYRKWSDSRMPTLRRIRWEGKRRAQRFLVENIAQENGNQGGSRQDDPAPQGRAAPYLALTAIDHNQLALQDGHATRRNKVANVASHKAPLEVEQLQAGVLLLHSLVNVVVDLLNAPNHAYRHQGQAGHNVLEEAEAGQRRDRGTDKSKALPRSAHRTLQGAVLGREGRRCLQEVLQQQAVAGDALNGRQHKMLHRQPARLGPLLLRVLEVGKRLGPRLPQLNLQMAHVWEASAAHAAHAARAAILTQRCSAAAYLGHGRLKVLRVQRVNLEKGRWMGQQRQRPRQHAGIATSCHGCRSPKTSKQRTTLLVRSSSSSRAALSVQMALKLEKMAVVAARGRRDGEPVGGRVSTSAALRPPRLTVVREQARQTQRVGVQLW